MGLLFLAINIKITSVLVKGEKALNLGELNNFIIDFL